MFPTADTVDGGVGGAVEVWCVEHLMQGGREGVR